MKSDFHFHFYSRLVIMAILAVSLIFIQKSVRSTAQMVPSPDDYEINGWAWAASAGWLSLNCFNDFVDPGVYVNDCLSGGGFDYGLSVEDSTGKINGCTWAGNALSSGGNPLGWVCFSDQDTLDGPSFSVTTSTTYLNALYYDTATPANSSFASIINQENWTCSGGVNAGLGCLKADEITDCPGSTCIFTDDGAWQLGFPITSPATPVSEVNPIEGCFNCYEEYNYACSIDGLDCIFGEDNTCSQTPLAQTCSVVKSIDRNCDNCLDYDYYLGQCERSDGTGSHNSCKNTDDCPVVASPKEETCQSAISLCSLDGVDCTVSGACSGVGNICTPIEVGTLKEVIGAYACSECTIESYDNVCGVNAYEGNLNSCKVCTSAWNTPGVMLDHKHYNLATGERATMCGWAWNAWDDGSPPPTYGLGWFQFGPRVVTTTRPYLSIEGGNIYSKGDIRGRYLPPFGHFNASYLIESGGSITNFVSSSTLAGTYQGEFSYRPIIEFPIIDSEFKYINALGSIDYYGLTQDFSSDSSNVNKYGSIINSGQTDVNVDNIFSQPLGGETYYFDSGALEILAGADDITVEAGGIASGVIAIEGNLTIRRNIKYETGVSYTNLKNIPSLIWLVKGDLTIDAAVTDLAGTFVVLGDDASTDVPPCSGNPSGSIQDGCGQIITCDPASVDGCEINPLTISGSVLARYFELGRLYANPASGQASERFVNDGRIQANPPPGFEDFSNVIPRFSEN